MGRDTSIEWTHHTFNPWWGCEKVSPECANCYAATFDKRIGGAHWGANAPRRFFGDAHWDAPVKWNASAAARRVRERVFCASQADVFEARAELAPLRDRLFDLIDATPWLDWLLLTKRADVMRAEFAGRRRRSNVWAGVSVGCNETRWRLNELKLIDASVRFVSAEPLLEELDLQPWLMPLGHRHGGQADDPVVCCCGKPEAYHRPVVDWIIGGAESGNGPRVRPASARRARHLRDQCVAAGVPFLWKQWGQYVPLAQAPFDAHIRACATTVDLDGEVLFRVRRKADAGRMLDGRTWDEYPEARV